MIRRITYLLIFALLMVLSGCGARNPVVGKWTFQGGSGATMDTTFDFRPDGSQTTTQHLTLGTIQSHEVFQGTYTVNADTLTITDKTATIGLDASTRQAMAARIQSQLPAGSSNPFSGATAADVARPVTQPPLIYQFQVSGDTLTLSGGNLPKDGIELHRVS